MEQFKCKMCGGTLKIRGKETVAECEYCGSRQTVPSADNDKKMKLFKRANRLRFACEFDTAAGMYQSLVVEFPREAEAYWGLVLCKYGIEYVDDPATGEKIPTCHRSSYDSVLNDENYAQALKYATGEAREVYQREANAIETLRSGIIEISAKEEPYDIFICYKETDEYGDRTIDSVLAQDLYNALTEQGYRVFFSRISLEDKLGQEYEPYIFAALHSAKVMLAVGTDEEYYNAVWVKNEWSRFLKLIVSGEKKTLIPCYKGLDAYDMPQEFTRLQAQDLGKVGATQDLLRGIEKIIPKKRGTVSSGSEKKGAASGDTIQVTVQSQMDRAEIFLEDEEWDKAYNCYEAVLNSNPKAAEAYMGEALCEYECESLSELKDYLLAPITNTPGTSENIGSHLSTETRNRLYSFVVPHYLTENDIRTAIANLGNYSAKIAPLQEQYEEVMSLFTTTDSNLIHAYQYAEGAYAQTLGAFKTEIEDKYKQAVKQAEEEDTRACLEAVMKVSQHVETLKSQAERAREADYQLVCQVSDINEINEALKRIDQLGDYKDCVSRKENLLLLQQKETEISSDPLYFGKWLANSHAEELQKYLDVAGGVYLKQASIATASLLFSFIAVILQIVILLMAIRGWWILVSIVATVVGVITCMSWAGKKENNKVSLGLACVCGVLLAYINISAKPIMGIIFTVLYGLSLFVSSRDKTTYIAQQKHLDQFREYETSMKEELSALWTNEFGNNTVGLDIIIGSIRGVDSLFDEEEKNGLLDRNYERWLASANFQLQMHPEPETNQSESSVNPSERAGGTGDTGNSQSAKANRIVKLNDEKGHERPFEFLDLIHYQNEDYVVLLPQNDRADTVVILKIEADNNSDMESYVSVSDEELSIVFNLFKERHKDEFDFTNKAR
ncbi:MAG: TIR domain-containing protein [Clostridiales bacterium]|nr:TIR domain-containing protein [Clostridiales bacterium]MCD8190568.1 TIR domain-containing protein [Clostridiales bacterium]